MATKYLKALEFDAKVDPEVFIAAALDLRSEEGSTFRASLPKRARQSLEFYDLVGEAWYPAQFYARQLERVRLYVGKRQPNGEVKEVENAPAQEILARIRDAGGGQSGWKGQYGRLMFLIGDGYLVASLDGEGNERWEYLSPAEFLPGDKRNGRKTYERKMPDGATKTLLAAQEGAELTDGTCRAWRLHNPHPLHSWLSDAPMYAVLSQFRLLMLLDKAAEAQALSRIVGAGLLVVDDRITIPANDSQASDDAVDDDPFMKLLTEYIVAPIGQPGSASQMAPLVARVQMPEGVRIDDLIKLVQLHDPNQTADWHERIEKTITRIAIGLDMPPEEFLGLAQANHWTGWVITEEKWKAHGEPVTIRLCEDLTSAYFRPACLAAEVEGAEDLIVWYDSAQVVAHPDRGKDAQAVFELGELSGQALRKSNNFSEDDAPSDEEREFFREMKLGKTERPDDPSEADSSQTGADAPGSAPAQNGDRTSQPSPATQEMSIIRGAAALAIARCREMAGSKIVSRRMSCEGCFKDMETVPKVELAAELGRDIVAGMLGFESPEMLVKGGASLFPPIAVLYGMDQTEADRMAVLIEKAAADSLFVPQGGTISFELSEEFKALSEAV